MRRSIYILTIILIGLLVVVAGSAQGEPGTFEQQGAALGRSADQTIAALETEVAELLPTVTDEPTATAEPTPTSTPLPPTATPTEEPDLTGQTCPAWVHDQYVTTGPDGQEYATWHPQIHPVEGCYFRHEHGSDPALFGDGTYLPVFDYAPQAIGMSEPHAGFKVHVWTNGGYDWMFVIHQGSSGHARVCVRFHSTNLVVARPGGEVVADLHVMGDYGEAIINRAETRIPLESCEGVPNHGGYETDPDGTINFHTDGEKHVPSYGADNIGYEPWILGDEALIAVLGFYGGDINVNVASSMTSCETNACERVVPSGGIEGGEYVYDMTQRHGAMRHFNYRVDSKKQFGVLDLYGTGTFTTNEFGTELGDVLIQYVEPGLSAFATSGGRHYPRNPDDQKYERYDQLPFFRGQLNWDDALESPN